MRRLSKSIFQVTASRNILVLRLYLDAMILGRSAVLLSQYLYIRQSNRSIWPMKDKRWKHEISSTSAYNPAFPQDELEFVCRSYCKFRPFPSKRELYTNYLQEYHYYTKRMMML